MIVCCHFLVGHINFKLGKAGSGMKKTESLWLSVLIMFFLPKYQVGLLKDCHAMLLPLATHLSPILAVRRSHVLAELVVMVKDLHSLPLAEFLKHLDMQSWRLFADDWTMVTPPLTYLPLVALHGNHIPSLKQNIIKS